MTDRERIAKELYDFAGRYGAHQGTLWGIAGDKTKEEHYKEADFLLGLLGYTHQLEPVLTRISDEEIKIANQIPPEEYGAEPNWWLRVSRKVAQAQLAHDQKRIKEAK